MAGLAFGAAGAVGGREDDVIAWLDAGDVGSDLLDDAGSLMAEDGGQRRGVHTVAHDGVGVADTGGDHPHPCLVGPDVVQVQLLDGQRLALLTRDCCGDDCHD